MNKCSREDCPIGMGIEVGTSEIEFDLRLNLSDQTGTLVSCRLNGPTAEAVLGHTVSKFM